jgi:hypothetical protein
MTGHYTNLGGFNPQQFYSQPTAGLGANNFQSIPPLGSGGLGGVGSSYLNSTAPGGGGPPGSTFFDSTSTMGKLGEGLGAFTSLAQLYGMFQSLGLQKKAFKFAQEGTKRNFNAQATAYNESIANRETSNRAYTAASGGNYDSLYAYGTGQKVAKWT